MNSFYGATDIPVLDFWWCLLWVSKPERASLFALGKGIHITHSLIFTSGATSADLLAASIDAEPISSTYLWPGIGGTWTGDFSIHRRTLCRLSYVGSGVVFILNKFPYRTSNFVYKLLLSSAHKYTGQGGVMRVQGAWCGLICRKKEESLRPRNLTQYPVNIDSPGESGSVLLLLLAVPYSIVIFTLTAIEFFCNRESAMLSFLKGT